MHREGRRRSVAPGSSPPPRLRRPRDAHPAASSLAANMGLTPVPRTPTPIALAASTFTCAKCGEECPTSELRLMGGSQVEAQCKANYKYLTDRWFKDKKLKAWFQAKTLEQKQASLVWFILQWKEKQVQKIDTKQTKYT